MSTSIQSAVTVSFDAEEGCGPVRFEYRFDNNTVELKQGANVISVPFDDAEAFVAILRKWVEENA